MCVCDLYLFMDMYVCGLHNLWCMYITVQMYTYLCCFVQGRQGDTVLVAGVSTGTAKVQVRLVDRTWKVRHVTDVHDD